MKIRIYSQEIRDYVCFLVRGSSLQIEFVFRHDVNLQSKFSLGTDHQLRIADRHMFETRKNTCDDKKSASEFKTNIGNRERVVGQFLSSLKIGISATEVMDMLGPPTTKTWAYTLFYSSAMVIYFDDSSKLVRVTSDISPETVTTWDESAPEISTASTQFKGKPYNRQVAAKMLLPLLKQGMPTKKVEDVLGRPDFISWRYSLTPIALPTNNWISILNLWELRQILCKT